MSKKPLILGIESSCDETAASLISEDDQGLPVIKFDNFKTTVNITLGLPIIRVSVDHGTALDLAGTGKVDISSFVESIKVAKNISNLSLIHISEPTRPY